LYVLVWKCCYDFVRMICLEIEFGLKAYLGFAWKEWRLIQRFCHSFSCLGAAESWIRNFIKLPAIRGVLELYFEGIGNVNSMLNSQA
jgi:hypothetical protein